jgi:hypothetical protein
MTRTALVSGALANKPLNGGNAWSRLSWVRGLEQMGFQVLFLEEISESHCVDALGLPTSFENSLNRSYFESVASRFGLGDRAALVCDGGRKVHGIPLIELARYAKSADLLFNLSGHLTLPQIKTPPACKVYYDDDPGFTQFWHAEGQDSARLGGHDLYFSIGMNIGAVDCLIPTNGIRWLHTRPPVVLDDWPACEPGQFDRFTTVASWRGAYGSIRHNGQTFGAKAHEFRKVLDLPRLSGSSFEIALQIHPADRKDLEALTGCGWTIREPQLAAGSCDDFRRYVRSSSAEFSVAQGVYVDTNSGWFSDRTVRYLASGRPALVHETGFSRHIPTGQGLLAFRTIEEAVEGAARIVRDYPAHCRAARRLAEEFFDCRVIIRRLAGDIGLTLPVKNDAR